MQNEFNALSLPKNFQIQAQIIKIIKGFFFPLSNTKRAQSDHPFSVKQVSSALPILESVPLTSTPWINHIHHHSQKIENPLSRVLTFTNSALLHSQIQPPFYNKWVSQGAPFLHYLSNQTSPSIESVEALWFVCFHSNLSPNSH